MLCRQGPSERYAPLGLSFPPLPRRVPSAHEAADGYAAPKAPAGQSCLDDDISVTDHATMAMLVSYSYEKANATRRRNVIRI